MRYECCNFSMAFGRHLVFFLYRTIYSRIPEKLDVLLTESRKQCAGRVSNRRCYSFSSLYWLNCLKHAMGFQ
ncbi:hypothetical protein FKM82_008874 [Ascaphus truei]